MKTILKFHFTPERIIHILMLVIVVLFAPQIKAQSESSIEDRLAKLEAQIAQQNTTIANLQSEVQSVVKQNLALKDALSLQPTIAEAKTEEFVYKLHEAVGDSATGTVTLYMTVTNTTPKDIDHYQWETVKFMDENGVQNPAFKDYEVTIGVNNDAWRINSLYSDAPTKLTVKLLNFDPKAQYVKVFEGDVYKDTKFIPDKGYVELKRSFTLRNIPIKWQ